MKKKKMPTNYSVTELWENRNQLMEEATVAFTKRDWRLALKYLKEAKMYDYEDSHIRTDSLIAESYEHLNNLFMADVYYSKADKGNNHTYMFQKQFYNRHRFYRPLKRLFVLLRVKYNDNRFEKCAK